MHTLVSCSHREQDLTNIHTSNTSVGLAPRPAHSGLEPIGTGTGQHLVDANNMVGVGTDAEVETFLASDFDEVSVTLKDQWVCSENCRFESAEESILVGADTSGFKGFRR